MQFCILVRLTLLLIQEYLYECEGFYEKVMILSHILSEEKLEQTRANWIILYCPNWLHVIKKKACTHVACMSWPFFSLLGEAGIISLDCAIQTSPSIWFANWPQTPQDLRSQDISSHVTLVQMKKYKRCLQSYADAFPISVDPVSTVSLICHPQITPSCTNVSLWA